MPIYEYVCDECKKAFEKLVMQSSEKVTCPQCGGRHHTLQLSVIASPAKSGSKIGNGASESAGSSCCNPSGCGCH